MSNEFMHQGDLIYRVERLERLNDSRFNARSLEASSIGAGGLDIIDGGRVTIDGGELVLLAPNGVELARWGDVSFGETSRGWELNYADGSRALIVGGTVGQQAMAIYDESGNYVMTTDGLSRNGIGRPYLNIPMVPSTAAQWNTGGPMWPSTNSTSLTEVLHGFTTIWHPRISFGMDTAASGGATEWELRMSGELVASGSGDANEIYTIPGWGDSTKPGAERVFQLLVRNTTGNISWAIVDKLYGRES
jgi:hypothetical protein